jgi:hypothetical protein
MFGSRPVLAMLPSNISYSGLFNLTVSLPQDTQLGDLSGELWLLVTTYRTELTNVICSHTA